MSVDHWQNKLTEEERIALRIKYLCVKFSSIIFECTGLETNQGFRSETWWLPTWDTQRRFNLFKANCLRDASTGLTFNNCTLCQHCIYMFCIYLRTNSELCHLHHKRSWFYNREEKCLLHGTDWDFKLSSLRFVCKGLIKMLCIQIAV